MYTGAAGGEGSYQFLQKLLGFEDFNGDRRKKHKKKKIVRTRVCSVSMKGQGMQSDNIMKCDVSLQWHVKLVQFKGQGLSKPLAKAWFQLVACKGPTTLKIMFINKMVSLWENLPVTYITNGKEWFELQFYKWSRPPKDCIPIRKLQSKRRHHHFCLFSAYIQMFFQSDNYICLLSYLFYLEGKKSWKLCFSDYLPSIALL